MTLIVSVRAPPRPAANVEQQQVDVAVQQQGIPVPPVAAAPAAVAAFAATAEADRARRIDGQLGHRLQPPADWTVRTRAGGRTGGGTSNG